MHETQLRILLVDDTPEILRVVQRGLHRHHTVAVGGATEAMAALAAERFDLVVSDNDMGEICGLVLLSHVARAHPHVRRIMFSGTRPPGLGDLCEAGIIEQFIAKPDFRQLVSVCDELATTESIS